MENSYIINKKRLYWVDALRGLLIILVILGHAFQRGDYGNSLLWNIIYSFHMSAFFVLSGWIGYKAELITIKTLFKRASNLLIPFFVWTIILVITNSAPEEYFSKFIYHLMHPDSTYWFLYTLFIVILVLEFWKRIANQLNLHQILIISIGEFIIFAIMVLFEPRLFGFQFIAYYSLFYCLGYLIRKYKKKFNIFQTITIGTFWFILACFWRMHDVPLPFKYFEGLLPDSILNYIYRLITAILGSLFFLSSSQIIFTSKRNKILEYLGSITLELYIIHLAFVGIADKVLIKFLDTTNDLIYSLWYFILITLLSVLIVAVIIHFPKTKRIFFGR